MFFYITIPLIGMKERGLIMKQEKFKELFDKFEVPKWMESFKKNEWDCQKEEWESFHWSIVSEEGLPIERWVKSNDSNYLPEYLESKKNRFGRARIGNFTQAMIYKNTGKDPNKNGKYFNAYYYKKDQPFDKIEDVEEDYKKHIQTLLKKICNAKTLAEVYDIENDDEYRNFKNKQILRKISILESVRNDAPDELKHAFYWNYDDRRNGLAELLGVEDYYEDGKTFLERNHLIYQRAKEWAPWDKEKISEEDYYVKLYSFLDYLLYFENNTKEIIDFVNPNIIFNGAPGTGKTYGITTGINDLNKYDEKLYKDVRFIQFHPSYTYQDFIEGIKPSGIDINGNVKLQVVNGSFKDFCIFVRKENEEYWNKLGGNIDVNNPNSFADWPHYFFVVDEINRGELSSIFGETFTLLEYRDFDFSGKYNVGIVPSNLVSTALSTVIETLNNSDLEYKRINGKVYFGIPFNIHFIGSMNDVDRSIDAFDLALRRRFKWVTKYCDYDVILNELLLKDEFNEESVNEYVESCKALNDFICSTSGLNLGKTYEIGHSFFLKIRNAGCKKKKIKPENKRIVFENYIEGTLKEYIRQVADENEIDSKLSEARRLFGN